MSLLKEIERKTQKAKPRVRSFFMREIKGYGARDLERIAKKVKVQQGGYGISTGIR